MALCRTARAKTIAVGCTGLCMLAIGLGLIPVINVVVDKKVRQSVILKEGGLQYDIWRNMTIPVYMQFYMFNLKNPEEVHNGETPDMEQRGPYTYRETRYKENITHHDNGTVSYRQMRVFKFDRNMSVGDETDQFTTINPPLMTLLTALRFQPEAVRTVISGVLRLTPAELFMTRPMKEIIWGYHDPLLKVAKKFDHEWFYTDYVGYFINKNNTDDGEYTVHTGETDISLLGVIDKYNGSSYLNFWSTPWANMVNGTDGTIAPPFIQDVTRLPTFSSDVCRSVYGLHSSDVKTTQGIPLHRFTGNQAELGNLTLNPDNIGFCTPQSSCFGTGVLNVSACQSLDYFQIPGVVSFPHFYLAEDKYVHGVYGMAPNKEEHETAIDIEPLTGLVLQAAKRLQINMHVIPIPEIQQTANIKPVVMPIFWVNESAAVDDVHAKQLQDLLFTPLLVTDIVKYGLIGVGAAMFLCSAIYAIWFLKSPVTSTNSSERSEPHRCDDSPDETTPLLYDEAYSGHNSHINRLQRGNTAPNNNQLERDTARANTHSNTDNMQEERDRSNTPQNTDHVQEERDRSKTPPYTDHMQEERDRSKTPPNTDHMQEERDRSNTPQNTDHMQEERDRSKTPPYTDHMQEERDRSKTPPNTDHMQEERDRSKTPPNTDHMQEERDRSNTPQNTDHVKEERDRSNAPPNTDHMQGGTAGIDTPPNTDHMQEERDQSNTPPNTDNMQEERDRSKTPPNTDHMQEERDRSNAPPNTDNMQGGTAGIDTPPNTDNMQEERDRSKTPPNTDNMQEERDRSNTPPNTDNMQEERDRSKTPPNTDHLQEERDRSNASQNTDHMQEERDRSNTPPNTDHMQEERDRSNTPQNTDHMQEERDRSNAPQNTDHIQEERDRSNAPQNTDHMQEERDRSITPQNTDRPQAGINT
ncbi:scavenger receptor class B member 1-like [Haliotis cracherodii]|uniref:scavenger receptor class B member 1-like n=1 Tax=Haliotis cracherodii TaxID=6455 RepID=UPI0039ECF971